MKQQLSCFVFEELTQDFALAYGDVTNLKHVYSNREH